MDKTLRLVRISFLIRAIQRVLRSVSGKLFYKSRRKLFSCVCIARYKHSRRWEISRQSCKPSTSSRVCITGSNSPNPSRVYSRLLKHRKRFLLLQYKCPLLKIYIGHSSYYYYLHGSRGPQRIYVSWMLWGLPVSELTTDLWPNERSVGSAANASHRPLYQSGVVQNHSF